MALRGECHHLLTAYFPLDTSRLIYNRRERWACMPGFASRNDSPPRAIEPPYAHFPPRYMKLQISWRSTSLRLHTRALRLRTYYNGATAFSRHFFALAGIANVTAASVNAAEAAAAAHHLR